MFEFETHLKQCKRGNAKALKTLYLNSFPFLLKVASRYATDQSMAKDILHDAFVKILTNVKSFEGNEDGLKHWMIRITTNEALQKLRRSKKLTFKDDLELYEKIAAPSVYSKLYSEDIDNTLQQIPILYKVVFLMKEIDGFSHKEISGYLDIEESHSRTILTRCKAILRIMLKSQTLTYE